MRERGSATVQAIMGVLCIHLLMGMLFAFLYGDLTARSNFGHTAAVLVSGFARTERQAPRQQA
jgi:hypothetical protein